MNERKIMELPNYIKNRYWKDYLPSGMTLEIDLPDDMTLRDVLSGLILFGALLFIPLLAPKYLLGAVPLAAVYLLSIYIYVRFSSSPDGSTATLSFLGLDKG